MAKGLGDVVLETRLSRTPVYKGKILSVYVDAVVTQSGRETVREIVDRPETVSILAIDDDDNVLLVRQFRYALGRETLEIPAGVVDHGESPMEAARRELREETGYDCEYLEELVAYMPAVGYCTERMTVYLARGLQPAPLSGDEEHISVIRMPFQELYESIVGGRSLFVDAKSTVAVLLARAKGKA